MSQSGPPGRRGEGWNPDEFQVESTPMSRSWEPAAASPPLEPEAEPQLDVEMRDPAPEGRSVRKASFALLIVAVIAVPIVFYMAAVPAVPVEAAPAAEAEDELPPRTSSTGEGGHVSAVQPSGGGSSASGGFYREEGNISDLFCRPRENETAEAWRRRVPLYCVDRFQAPAR